MNTPPSNADNRPKVIISFGVTTHGSSVQLLNKDKLANVRWISPECDFCSVLSTAHHAKRTMRIAHNNLAQNLTYTLSAVNKSLSEIIADEE